MRQFKNAWQKRVKSADRINEEKEVYNMLSLLEKYCIANPLVTF